MYQIRETIYTFWRHVPIVFRKKSAVGKRLRKRKDTLLGGKVGL